MDTQFAFLNLRGLSFSFIPENEQRNDLFFRQAGKCRIFSYGINKFKVLLLVPNTLVNQRLAFQLCQAACQDSIVGVHRQGKRENSLLIHLIWQLVDI